MATNLKQVTATGLAVSGKGLLKSVTLAAGSDAATVQIQDSAAGGGTNVLKLAALLGDTVEWVSGDSEEGWAFGTGVYVTLTGTSPAVTLEYE